MIYRPRVDSKRVRSVAAGIDPRPVNHLQSSWKSAALRPRFCMHTVFGKRPIAAEAPAVGWEAAAALRCRPAEDMRVLSVHSAAAVAASAIGAAAFLATFPAESLLLAGRAVSDRLQWRPDRQTRRRFLPQRQRRLHCRRHLPMESPETHYSPSAWALRECQGLSLLPAQHVPDRSRCPVNRAGCN